MGFRLAVSGGAENINLDEKTVRSQGSQASDMGAACCR